MPRVLNLISVQIQEFGSAASRFFPKAKMSPRHDLMVLREHLANRVVFFGDCWRRNNRLERSVIAPRTPSTTDGLSHGKRNVARLQCASTAQIQRKDVHCHLDD